MGCHAERPHDPASDALRSKRALPGLGLLVNAFLIQREVDHAELNGQLGKRDQRRFGEVGRCELLHNPDDSDDRLDFAKSLSGQTA